MFIKPLTKEIIKNLWNHTSKVEEYLRNCYETRFPVRGRIVLLNSSPSEGFDVYYGGSSVISGMNSLEKNIIRLLFFANIASEAYKKVSKKRAEIHNVLHLKD